MKTLEQKAKAYDEALERMKSWARGEHPEYFTEAQKAAEFIFPELKESQDEKTKRILHSISSKMSFYLRDIFTEEEFQCFDAWSNAWIEKQGEKKFADKIEPKFKVGDKIQYLKDCCTIMTIEKIENGEYIFSNNMGHTTIESGNEWHLVNLVEQKPASKVKPKFKVGDFLVNDYCMGRVVELTDDAYLLDTGQGIPFSCEHNAHLWTIQDAKDGDFLVRGKDKSPFIFKGFDRFHPDCPVAYCGMCEDGTVGICTGEGWWTDEEVFPATKEQRDLLFQKMREAGYNWDVEKKELKKIELKPTDNVEPKFHEGDIIKPKDGGHEPW